MNMMFNIRKPELRIVISSFFKHLEAKFKEFEPRLKFDSWLKDGWFHLKLYSMFLDLSRR